MGTRVTCYHFTFFNSSSQPHGEDGNHYNGLQSHFTHVLITEPTESTTLRKILLRLYSDGALGIQPTNEASDYSSI